MQFIERPLAKSVTMATPTSVTATHRGGVTQGASKNAARKVNHLRCFVTNDLTLRSCSLKSWLHPHRFGPNRTRVNRSDRSD